MIQTISQRFFTRFTNTFKLKESPLGRWSLNDNREIKATLANMDSCGDSLCGSPKTYKESISVILSQTSSEKSIK